jgi:PAS domain S-box-containing protein
VQDVLLEGQRALLALVARRAPLPTVLDTLCRLVERSLPGTLCSVLLVSEDGAHLRHGAGPSLPEAYRKLIDGLAIAPGLGSCGTAAYRREPVVVTDIASDPLWRGYEEIARSFGLGACASTPIVADPAGELLGTFAIYHPHAGAFAKSDLQLLFSLSHLAAIAILNHRREEALQASQGTLARLEALSETLEAHVALDGRWLRVPESLRRKLGRTEAEIRATRFQDILDSADVETDRAQFARLSRGEIDSLQTESRLLCSDAAAVWVSLQATLVRDTEGAPAHLVVRMRDITERKRAEEQLRAAQRMESAGMVAGGLAHDVNNLLTAVVCSIDLAQLDLSSQSRGAIALSDAGAAAREAARMTRRMLALASPGRHVPRVVDVNDVVRESARIFEAPFCRGIRLELALAHDETLIDGDPVDLQQLLMNLVINAAQAIDSKGDRSSGDRAGGTIRVHTRLEDLREDDLRERFRDQPLAEGLHVALEVSDTGCGMTAEALRRMFDAFYTTKPTGRGLGLTVVRGILRQHRAGYEVSSEVGRGTSFRVYFRVADPSAARPVPPPARPHWPAARGEALVVEDATEVRRIVVAVLGAYGFAVREVSDGQSALMELAKRAEEISLVLLDLASNRAIPAIQSMRERWPELRIVITTSGDDQPVAEVASSDRIAVLQKPYGRLDLKRAIFGEVTASRVGAAGSEMLCPECRREALIPSTRRITVDRGRVFEAPVPAVECSECGKMFAGALPRDAAEPPAPG